MSPELKAFVAEQMRRTPPGRGRNALAAGGMTTGVPPGVGQNRPGPYMDASPEARSQGAGYQDYIEPGMGLDRQRAISRETPTDGNLGGYAHSLGLKGGAYAEHGGATPNEAEYGMIVERLLRAGMDERMAQKTAMDIVHEALSGRATPYRMPSQE